MFITSLKFLNFLFLATQVTSYKPSETDVDAFVNALNAYPIDDPDLVEWRALWTEDNPNSEFCRNGDCIKGLDAIVESFVMFGGLMSQNVNYTVFEWAAGESVLVLEDTLEFLVTTGNCTFAEDTPRILYYDEDGKIWAVHQPILPDDNLNIWLNAAVSGTVCNFEPPPPPTNMSVPDAYKPGQADVDAFVSALEAWPVDDPNLTEWKALFAESEDTVFCRNGECTYGLDNIVQSFVAFGPVLRDNTIYTVNEWFAGFNTLWLKDTLETLTTQGGCVFKEDTPRLMYYSQEGKITAVHQTIVPDDNLMVFLMNGTNQVQCEETPDDPPDDTSGTVGFLGTVIATSVGCWLAFIM